MNGHDSLPDAVTEIFGEEATAEQAYDLLTVDVPPSAWLTALETARDALGCTYFDWLSAVDEPGTGFRVCAHVVALGTGGPRRLLLRTTVPHEAAVLPTAIGVYAGAGWHERETHEMFGVVFEGHPHLVPLLLPENFEGHPLRKDFVLAARVAKAWPGAKEPGESHDGGGPKRRQMLPPGVPDPNEWGPLKGQLPPAPARPARAAAGDRPVRRTRTATEGSASQAEPTAPARRARSASEGSASRTAADPAAPPRRSRSASEGSVSQAVPEPEAPAPAATPEPEAPAPAPDASPDAPAARPPRRSRSAADGSASQQAPDTDAPRTGAATPRTRSADAPWHHARPAFDDETPSPATPPATEAPAPAATPAPEPEAPAPAATPAPEPEAPRPDAPEPEAPASEGTPAAEPDAEAPTAPRAPEPEAPAPAGPPAPGPEDAPAADTGEERSHEPPAGRDRTDTPNDPAGGDPA
ncbi:NADH-quinone oxidoreductase subunit C [Streptomyces sp. NPDC004266]|uniref:NADH-quinone oxidoreductase subunit C n=1 Tax=Streptomyces sp. NPDC004266 TaxID=3364693 RepID=UPI0036CF1D52